MKTKVDNRLKYLLGLVLLIVLTLVAYYPSFDNHFVSFDDPSYVTANALICNPSYGNFKELITKIVALNYHPITMISLWLNAKISGVESATPFIVTNVTFHILNSIMAFLLAYKLTDKRFIIAILTAITFALHPMHVESVVWVSERKDVLYTFFFFASLLSYCKYLSSKKSSHFFSCFLLFLFSCFSKAMAVSLVPCLFALDYLRFRDFKRVKLYMEKVPFVLLGLFVGFMAIDVQDGGDFYGWLTVSKSSHAIGWDYTGVIERLKNSCFANYFYISKFFIPNEHSPFHPYRMIDGYSAWLYIPFAILMFVILTFSFIYNKRILAFSIAFYISTILLVLQLIPVGSAVVAERYTYLPYFGLAIIVGYYFQQLWQLGYKQLIFLLLPILCYFLIANTRIQSDVWQNHVSLFNQAVELYPYDSYSRKALARGFWNIGEFDKSIYHIKYAINDLGVVTSSAFELLANCYSEKGMKQEAIAFFNESVRLDSTNIMARFHRGLEILDTNPSKAIDDFNFCEKSSYANVKPLLLSPRGRAHGLLGNYNNALDDLNLAIKLFPDDVNNYLDKAITLENLNELEEAEKFYLKALELNHSETLAIDRLKILRATIF